MDDLVWRKASASGKNGAYVEVAEQGDQHLMRDSKDPAGPVLAFTQAEWAAFIAGAKAGEFD
jgi:hypothetical protein